MKVYIMTDIEGAAGVLDFVNWAQADGKYHEEAKMLLTEEVNAAIDGFCAEVPILSLYVTVTAPEE